MRTSGWCGSSTRMIMEKAWEVIDWDKVVDVAAWEKVLWPIRRMLSLLSLAAGASDASKTALNLSGVKAGTVEWMVHCTKPSRRIMESSF